jgi:hypothetical protein
VTGNGISTGDAVIEVGGARSGSGNAFIDFHSTSGTDYEFRILRPAGANGAAQLINTGTGGIIASGDGTTASLVVTSGNNVGVGVSTPGGKLGVAGHVSLASGGLIAFQGATVAPTTANYALYGDGTTTAFNVPTGGALIFNEANAEVGRFHTNGNFGLGTLTPGSKLSVVGTAAAGTTLSTFSTGPAGADNTSVHMLFLNSTNTNVNGSITRNGTNTIAFNTTSDKRLKENIQESTIGLAALMQLKVYDYTWKGTGDPAHGFIAQEVQDVYAYAVREGGDNPVEEPWMIEYGRLTPLLVRAVQQQQVQLREALARIEALESR